MVARLHRGGSSLSCWLVSIGLAHLYRASSSLFCWLFSILLARLSCWLARLYLADLFYIILHGISYFELLDKEVDIAIGVKYNTANVYYNVYYNT